MIRMAQKEKKKTPAVRKVVEDAIRSLKEPGGSSLHAIKKYFAANYVDAKALSPAIKEYLKAAAASGCLLQPTGRGATDSFKLAAVNPAILGVTAAQGHGRRHASGPKGKKGQKQPLAKNTQLQSRVALKTPRNPAIQG